MSANSLLSHGIRGGQPRGYARAVAARVPLPLLRHWRPGMLEIIGSLALLAVRLDSQQVRVLGDVSSCAQCGISVTRVASLGKQSDPELFTAYPSVQHDTHGRFLVSATIRSSTIQVYAADGRWTESWGRQGSGPGEFRAITDLVLFEGDSLLVIDAGARRATVLETHGRYSRSFPLLLSVTQIGRLHKGDWLASGPMYDPERIGYPLHHLAPDGSIRRSFGGEDTVVAGRPSAAQRAIAVAPDGVWTCRPGRYVLEKWSLDGRLLSVLDRRAAWFPHRENEVPRNNWITPIVPRVRDIHLDDRGILWVMGVVPKDGWKPSPDNMNLPIAREALNYDAFVEAIDVRLGQLLASARLPWSASGFTSDGLIVSYHETNEGIMVIDVFQPTLTNYKAAK
jgi:hypothetical protein